MRIPVLEVFRHYEAGVFTLEGKTGFRAVTGSTAIGDVLARVLRSACFEFPAEESPAKIFTMRDGDGDPLFIVAPHKVDVASNLDEHRAVFGMERYRSSQRTDVPRSVLLTFFGDERHILHPRVVKRFMEWEQLGAVEFIGREECYLRITGRLA